MTDSRGPEATTLAVETRGLSKKFGHQLVVDNLDLAVPQGAVYGFLGPNGSGKTTTIRMLLGLIRASSGTATILGDPVDVGHIGVLSRVGALVEGPAFHPYLSGEANLRRVDAADLGADPTSSRQRISAALERVGLAAAATKRYRAYSLGMKQRLGIAAALLQPRDLLILDEPTNGLDPQGTREVRALLGQLNAEGVTILISSHLLSEVEQVCSHIGVVRAGKLVAQGEISTVQQSARQMLGITTSKPEVARELLTAKGLTEIEFDGLELRARLDDSHEPEQLARALVLADVPISRFQVERPSLEDLFIALTGEGFDVSG